MKTFFRQGLVGFTGCLGRLVRTLFRGYWWAQRLLAF